MASLPFLDEIITFPNGTSFQRLDSITDFRQCHGVSPPERRILYRCRCLPSSAPPPDSSNNNNTEEDEEYILKIKVQIPDPSPSEPPMESKGPSDATTHELKALQLFRDASSAHGPHLIAFSNFPQSSDGPLPSDYISCTVMSKLPGVSLFELGYWSLETWERTEIQKRFLDALAAVRKTGIEPGDKGLRNVMWDPETKKCGLVDFEMWEPYSETTIDSEEERLKELQKWGLAHKPPAKNWWAEFGIDTC